MQIRNEELSSSDTSSDEGERTLNNLTAEELEAEGLCSLFSYDDNKERNRQSGQKLDALVFASHIHHHGDEKAAMARNKYFAYLNNERASEYYQSLQAKLDNNEKLLASEYYYFAMTTDNVSKLNVTALQRMSEMHHIQNLDHNISVLILARAWQDTTDPTEKKSVNDLLRQALENRGNLRRANCEMFLNLHGINLSGADLSMSCLDFIDLGNADLSNCNLYDTIFHFSNLDYANLSNPDCVRPDLKGRIEQGPCIRFSSVKNACFDHMTAPNVNWSDSDFTGSSFKNAKIGHGNFTETIFDHCDFSSSVLSFTNSYERKSSLKFANLMNAQLVHADYASLDLTGAQLMPYTAFSDAQSLCAALDIINAEVMKKLRTLDTSEWHRTSQINSFQKMMAENIIFHLGHLSFSHMAKAFIIESALEHELFLPEKYLHQLAFRAERNIYSFFSNQTHEAYATEAVKMLELARDDELQEDNMLRMN